MISNSETTQTLTIGIAFIALFAGAISSLDTTKSKVLYMTNAEIAAASSSGEVVDGTVEKTSPEPTAGEISRLATLSTQSATADSAASSEINTQPMQKASTETAQNTDEKTPKEVHEEAQSRAQNTKGGTPVMTSTDKREILWLARIMYSETKRADEQRLIGWVVRNRVDTGYTGRTYEDVAKHSNQFSGLQPYDARYEHNISRWRSSPGKSWEAALQIAKEVYFADSSERPIALTTRHFYSPNAVAKTPVWAQNRQAAELVKDPQTKRVRFALYDKIR